MTRPISESSTQKQMGHERFGRRQLFRRPGVTPFPVCTLKMGTSGVTSLTGFEEPDWTLFTFGSNNSCPDVFHLPTTAPTFGDSQAKIKVPGQYQVSFFIRLPNLDSYAGATGVLVRVFVVVGDGFADYLAPIDEAVYPELWLQKPFYKLAGDDASFEAFRINVGLDVYIANCPVFIEVEASDLDTFDGVAVDYFIWQGMMGPLAGAFNPNA